MYCEFQNKRTRHVYTGCYYMLCIGGTSGADRETDSRSPVGHILVFQCDHVCLHHGSVFVSVNDYTTGYLLDALEWCGHWQSSMNAIDYSS